MKIDVVRKGDIFINRAFSGFLKEAGIESHEHFMRLDGKVAKSIVKERTTMQVTLGERILYIKKHRFPGLKEVLKLLFRLRLPRSALNEWHAILAFHEHGIPTMVPVASGRKLIFGVIEKESFLLTDNLADAGRLDYYLEEKFPGLCRAEELARKRGVLWKLADLSRKMHDSGFNHRDFYLCHIFIDAAENLFVIDLHRVDIRGRVGRRWIIKDLAALLFSSLDVPVTWGQRLAFYMRYMSVSRLSPQDKCFIRAIIAKCSGIARHTRRMCSRAKQNPMKQGQGVLSD